MITRSKRLFAALAAAAVVVVAAPSAARAQDLPVLNQPVNDLAQVIDPSSAAQMDQMIRSLQTATGDAVIVASVKSFAPFGSIEEYAVKLFERAGIGAKGKDNGVLILVAVGEHRARIEVGYGLEGFLTDGVCGEIIRTQMLPAFRRGAYGEGLLGATTQVVSRIAKERNITLADLPAPAAERASGHRDVSSFGPLVFLLILLVFFVISRASGGGRGGRGGGGSGLLWFLAGQMLANSGRRGWNGGGFGGGGFGGGGFGGGGGGFGGFGGGGSGGGGASGGW